MALLKFDNKRVETVSAEIGANIWKILNGEVEATKAQEDYIATITEVILNWRNAPDSYINHKLDLFRTLALGDWMCDRQGNITRPSDDTSWKFAKRWGLWEHGQKTSIVDKLAR